MTKMPPDLFMDILLEVATVSLRNWGSALMVAQEVPQWHDKYEAAQHPAMETLAKILQEMASAVKEERDIDPERNESLRKAFAELARKPN